MGSNYHFNRSEDPFFKETEILLRPLIGEIQAHKPDAPQKAIRIMCAVLSKIPLSFFKERKYTRQVITAVKIYLNSSNIKAIKKLARKRKTDRLEMIRAIACDCLEYFSFLPAQLEADPSNVSMYIQNIDNMLWILRRIRPNKNCFALLQYHLRKP